MDEDLEAQRQRQRSEAQAQALPPDDPEKLAREKAGALREEIRAKAQAWVEEHWGKDTVCPMCGGGHWGLYEPVALRPYGAPPFRNAVFPACPASCQKCGYTVFLNLLVVGLVEGYSDEEPSGGKEG